MKADLNDVIECIEFEGELLTHYYNKNTGVIMYIEDSSTATYKADDIYAKKIRGIEGGVMYEDIFINKWMKYSLY